MLRELSQLLDELHDGLVAIEARDGMRLSAVEMTLPIDVQPVFRDGGCVLLADFTRSSEVNAWIATPSRLTLAWTSGDDAGAQA